MNEALEKQLVDCDIVIDTLEAIGEDVYRPDMYSHERLAKYLREHIKSVTDLMKSHRQELEQEQIAQQQKLKIVGGKAS